MHPCPNQYVLSLLLLYIHVECPLLPDPEGGSVVITGFTPGNVAIYSCAEPGTQLSGDSLRICEPTGVWSGSQPTCIG